ncbi:MAG: STAS domain-containing protein [Spongiibacteraceae bacterium]
MNYAGKDNGTAVLRLSGRFDFSAFRPFRELYEPLLSDSDVSVIELNFAAVEYVDSAALGMLLMLRDKGEKLGKKVVLSGCGGNVQQLLEVANFQQLFEIA